MNGYHRLLLSVDLASGRIETLPLDAALLRRFLGGSALSAALLYPRLRRDLDPLEPDNPLLILNGPLSGTAGPSVGRFTVCAKSPATGLWGESNCGGFFGPELRFAGYDGLLVTGRAASPVYLWIKDDRAELRPADHLWGRADTYLTQDRLRAEVGEKLARVLCIGAGGERLIPFSLLLCDHGRVAGRTGLGAVMGSKNLKAVAVRGTKKIPLAREAEFNKLRSAANLELRNHSATTVFRETGSAGGAEYFDFMGEMPKRYFTSGVFEGAARVSGAAMSETILSGVSTCHACVIACGRKVTLPGEAEGKGPEYETIVGFGPQLLVDDLAAITRLGRLCDAYGLDTISMSNVIGLAYLLYAEGKLSAGDAGGPLEWGEPAGAERLIHLTIRCEGLGEVLAQGAKALGRAFGAEELAAQVNNLEAAYHDPRASSGMALVYATSPRGACHNQSDFFMADLWRDTNLTNGELQEPLAGGEKAPAVALHQDWRTVHNALVQCFFASVPLETTLHLVNAAAGFDYSLDELRQVGERAWNLKRAINHRLGLTRANDKLPKLFLQPYADGGAAGFAPDLEAMLPAYYAARGWDAATGRPTRATLERLGLPDVADDLSNLPQQAGGGMA
jgi:aldehyde:ferredoxin oxidoreductase